MQCIDKIMIYYWEKTLKKKIAYPGSWYNKKKKKKKYWFDVSCSKDVFFFFLQDVFQMMAIVLVSVINHYHINGLHLFWDTLYIGI